MTDGYLQEMVVNISIECPGPFQNLIEISFMITSSSNVPTGIMERGQVCSEAVAAKDDPATD